MMNWYPDIVRIGWDWKVFSVVIWLVMAAMGSVDEPTASSIAVFGDLRLRWQVWGLLRRHWLWLSDIPLLQTNGLRFTFVCPSNAIFNQKEMTCDHNVSEPELVCSQSPDYYNMNALLYTQNKHSLNASQLTSLEAIFVNQINQINQNSFNNRPSVQLVKTRAPVALLKSDASQRRTPINGSTSDKSVDSNQECFHWLPFRRSVTTRVQNQIFLKMIRKPFRINN